MFCKCKDFRFLFIYDLIATTTKVTNVYRGLNICLLKVKCCRASLMAQQVKNLRVMQEMQVWSLSQENFLKEEMATLVFLQGNPMDRGAWWAVVQRVTKSHIWLSMSLEYFTYFIPLYGEGNGNPLQYSCRAGCSLWGCRELDTTEQLTHTHTHTHTCFFINFRYF